MKSVWCGLLGLAALGAACCASGQVTETSKGYLFRAKYEKGRQISYTARTTIQSLNQSGKPFDINLRVTLRVLKVQKGLATLQLTLSPPSHKGAAIDSPRKSKVVLDSTNHSPGGSDPGNVVIEFPKAPVKMSGEWRALTQLPFGKGQAGQVVTNRYRLTGSIRRGAMWLLTLHVQVEGIAKGSGSVEIDGNDGSLVDSDFSLVLQPQPSLSIPIKLSVRRTK